MKKTTIITITTLFVFISSFAQTISIGKQIWMTQNLNVDKFRNGDKIRHAKTVEEWKNAANNKQPAWCYYDNDPSNGEKYGKLYNWYAVRDSRGLAPKGFHVPTDDEWEILTTFLGGNDVAGTKMKKKIGWGENYSGTNSSGFSALPGGYRQYGQGFYDVGFFGNWWSDTEAGTSVAWYRRLNYHNGETHSKYTGAKRDGFSVRCIMD